jgi:HAD superfamily hydrolase (TIGR01509 family)
LTADRRTIETVVFDLGGVLIDWDPRYLFRKLLPDDDTVERFLSTVCTPEWNARQDAGRPFAAGIEELLAVHPEHEALIRAYVERWAEMLGGPIAESVELLEELHAGGIPLFALSNWSSETFPVASDRYAFLGRFRGIVVSGHEGVAKPHPDIFRVLVRRFRLEPEACLLVDDSEENVRVADSLGFVTERFTSPPDLRRRLARLGLLTDA